MIVYRVTNLLNNKVYIGQTIQTLKKRWWEHKNSNRCTLMYRALQKYGVENFKIEVIETCKSIEEMNEREKFYIKFHNSTDKNFGYNLREGGDNSLHSEESKLKMSESQKKRGPVSEETKEKLRYERSEAEKERIRNIWVDRKHTPESIEKMKLVQSLVDNESRNKKISEALKGKPKSAEHRKNVSLAQAGKKRKPMSEETKRKIGEANKRKRGMNEKAI